MAEYHAAITVNTPVHQVYTLFTHLHDFPKFMSFVKESPWDVALHGKSQQGRQEDEQ